MGWTCCYQKELIANVQTEHSLKLIELKLREKKNSSQYTLQSDTDKKDWFWFYFVQALDIHSTVEGLKYSCIQESNPFLPPVPHRDHLILHKALLMFTIFRQDYWKIEEINALTIFTGAVVITNQQLANKATCPLR